MKTAFSKKLVELRRRAGHKTAYSFFHGGGGEGVLKMSYRSYLMAEQGRSLPLLSKMSRLVWALRVGFESPEARDLVAAWLRLSAGEETYDGLIAPMLSGAAAALSPEQQAITQSLKSRTCNITLEQMRAIHASLANYKCQHVFHNNVSPLTAEALTADAQVTAAEGKKAIKDLLSVRLLKKASGGRYQGITAGKFLIYPPNIMLPPEIVEAAKDYNLKLAAASKKVLWEAITLRASEAQLRNFIPIMKANLNTAAAYAIHTKTADSALFEVSGTILKLWDF